jgi:hypothetical protein
MRFSWDFVRWCFMMFHDVSWCFTMFHDVWWLESKNTHETTSNKNLMKIPQMLDELVCVHTMRFSWRFCSTLFHNVSWMFGTTFMKHRRTKSHKCLTLFKTRPHDETFMRFCLALFANVSRCIGNVSRFITNVRCCITKISLPKSHKNLTKISSCGRALRTDGDFYISPSPRAGHTEKLPQKFKIVKIYWHELSLKSYWRALSHGTID